MCYLRENGPIAYELSLFPNNARAAIESMLSTGFAWYWCVAASASGSREWTQLTRWSLGAFLPDLERADVFAVGVEATTTTRWRDRRRRRSVAAAVLRGAAGPRACVHRRRDGP